MRCRAVGPLAVTLCLCLATAVFSQRSTDSAKPRRTLQVNVPAECRYNRTPRVLQGPEPPAIANAGDLWQSPVDGSQFVAVPAGSFLFGTSQEVRPLNGVYTSVSMDRPLVIKVHLPGFWIQRFEVTNAQFARFVQAKIREGYQVKSTAWQALAAVAQQLMADQKLTQEEWDNLPAVGISVLDAAAYAEWINGSLPTEAQWEKAARGTQGEWWPWGNQADLFDIAQVNFADASWPNSPRMMTHRQALDFLSLLSAHPEGRSPYGAYNMAGNVAEWTGSLHRSRLELNNSAYAKPDNGLPQPVSLGLLRMMGLEADPIISCLTLVDDPAGKVITVKGGSWRDSLLHALAYCRRGVPADVPTSLALELGFRCVINRPVSEPVARPTVATRTSRSRCSATFELLVGGEPVVNAQLTDFNVWERQNRDGWVSCRPDDLQEVASKIERRRIMLVVDCSGSMTAPAPRGRGGAAHLATAKQTAAGLAALLGASDRVGLVRCDGRPEVVRSLGAPEAGLAREIGRLNVGLDTALYDALMLAMDHLMSTTADEPNVARSVVAFTDGRDTSSRATQEDVLKRAQDTGIRIYIVTPGLAPSLEALLRKLAEQTGGQYLRTTRPKEIEPVLAKGVEITSVLYTLTWISDLPPSEEREALIDYLGAPVIREACRGFFLPLEQQGDLEAQ